MKKLIGNIILDSGQLAIADPCFFLDDEAYKKACLGEKDFKEHIFSPPSGSGVVVAPGGDGLCPVYLEYDQDRPARLIIDFSGD